VTAALPLFGAFLLGLGSRRWLQRHVSFLVRAQLAGGIGLLLGTAGPAQATTSVSKSKGELGVAAARGYANTISVSLVGSTYYVTDSGDTVLPVVGSGCNVKTDDIYGGNGADTITGGAAANLLAHPVAA
jgi:hypothetical protein